MRRLLFFGLLLGLVTTGADLCFVFAHAVGTAGVIAGAHVGMLGLALYGVAYRGLEPLIPGAAGRAVWVAGALGGGLGAAVHGVTAMAIVAAKPGEAGSFLVPSQTFAAAPLLLPPLWGFLALLGLVGSVVYAVQVGRGRSRLPRWAAAVNPAALSLLISLLGAATPAAEAFAALSANVAHVFFFGGLLVAVRGPGEDAP